MRFRIMAGLAGAVCAALLYGYGLGESGLLGPDEPRYSDIGRAMQTSGDWTTPRLFGEPWFEKPALIYWMGALGFTLGAGDSLAPRLLMPILGIGFLAFYFWRLRGACGAETALAAVAILSTGAGWIGFSHAAVTDLPLTVFFSAGMLLAMPWALDGDRRLLPWAAACFAMASLAKGLVPLVLAAPLAIFGWRRILDWFRPAPVAAFALIGLPWYLLCYWRNGWPFFDEFFLQHHVGRFFREDLQHVQPAWFYLPVFAGLLLPWTPLFAAFATRTLRDDRAFWRDRRLHFFAAWLGFGLLFFSASTNKLPGYLLPLLPAAAAILGLALSRLPRARWILGSVALSAAAFALAGGLLPEALSVGLRRTSVDSIPWLQAAPSLLVAAAVIWAERQGRRHTALALLVALIAANVGLLKFHALPSIRKTASVVELWAELAPQADAICIERIHRSTEFGLRYYSHGRISLCVEVPRPLRLIEGVDRVPYLEASTEATP
ncbi:MAG: phospholipid carrier-dependent glycosyltransferase [Bryobacterales bacterium]|nr:phospholipid carrier-dependent glycosyltransferase [Bryobacterales bacterium]